MLKTIISFILLTMLSSADSRPMFSFSPDSDAQWRVVNDGVMGGLSSATLTFDAEGIGHWEGEISLKNNGGFSSIRSPQQKYKLSKYKGLKARVKGDGRKYGFTLRNVTYFNGISYSYYFDTKPGEWMTVEVPFSDFEGAYYGRTSEMVDPLDPDDIKEIGLILYDKKSGPFHMDVDFVDTF